MQRSNIEWESQLIMQKEKGLEPVMFGSKRYRPSANTQIDWAMDDLNLYKKGHEIQTLNFNLKSLHNRLWEKTLLLE